jgi:hypothetical protein
MRSSPGEGWHFSPARDLSRTVRPSGGSVREQTQVTLQNLAGVLEQLGADTSAVASGRKRVIPLLNCGNYRTILP